ncbi:hypothetical protein HYH03_001274 [Edaphochlamys debaryana]|uniref:Uncharacterized protein n=1 Tax=Edaphochlamys debaryana TaxID=47281 RepID=A0A835YL03_9CHLO|nr:hypothetical protein HYH03_001274 [Edaphochlamys debaryana]|eukprot:KAG2500495.1 hypothetical protein HYH03_001274 [Edaphochlamys debaryana]
MAPAGDPPSADRTAKLNPTVKQWKQKQKPELAKAVGSALRGTELLREEAARLHLLQGEPAREEYADAVLQQRKRQGKEARYAAAGGTIPPVPPGPASASSPTAASSPGPRAPFFPPPPKLTYDDPARPGPGSPSSSFSAAHAPGRLPPAPGALASPSAPRGPGPGPGPLVDPAGASGPAAGRLGGPALRLRAGVAGAVPAVPPERDLAAASRGLVERAAADLSNKSLQPAQMALEVQRQGLERQAAQLEAQQGAKLLGARKRQSLREALAEDQRLAALPAKQVLAELVAAGRAQGGGGVSLEQFVAAKEALQQAATPSASPGKRRPQPHAPSAASPGRGGRAAQRRGSHEGPGRGSDGDGEEGEDGWGRGSGPDDDYADEEDEEEEEGIDEDPGSSEGEGEGGGRAGRGGGPTPTAADLLSKLRPRWERAEDGLDLPGPGPSGAHSGPSGPRGGRIWSARNGGRPRAPLEPEASGVALEAQSGPGGVASGPSEAHLAALAGALRQELPAQEAALSELRTKRDVTAARLLWAQQKPQPWAPPSAQEQAEAEAAEAADGDPVAQRERKFREMLAAQRRRNPGREVEEKVAGTRKMCAELVHDLLPEVMGRIAHRPSKAQVAQEVAAWRAARPGDLLAVSRHLAEGLLGEVVDELIAEAFDEMHHLVKVADSFAFDLLVEAVAFSQRKYQFGPGADNVRSRLRDAAVRQEAQLAQSVASRRAAALARTLSRKANPHIQGGSSAQVFEDDEGEDPHALYGPANPVPGLPNRSIKAGAPPDEDLDEEAIYLLHRDFDDTHMRRDEKQLYVQGLKAMLEEMRARRASAPYGHTQQLSVYWPPYVRVTRAHRLAAQRVRPPLAAGPSAWRRMALPAVGRAPHAPWPRPDHTAAAATERLFWGQVALRPTYLTSKNAPMVQVFKELGPITALSASPSGALLAVGTAPGAMLVFDMRGRPAAPWFQVLGDGTVYRRPWLRFRRRRPRNPALVALAWSADGAQLASLDASSVLRMWWMRPEQGSLIKEDPHRQPVAPELALSVGPLNMTLSGKGPVLETLLEEGAWGAFAPGGAAPPPPAGGGAAAAQAAAANAAAAQAAALSRRWCIAFHPEFNIVGVQPSLLVPQLTGDVVRLTSLVGSALLPAPLPRTRQRPRALLSQQVVDYLLPPQIPSGDVRTQALFRGHDAPLVFVGVAGDCASVISVDAVGEVNLWPLFEGARSGFGWFRPRTSWHLPRTLRSYQARGPLHPVWPRVPVAALKGVMYNPPPPAAVAHLTGAGGAQGGGFWRSLWPRRGPPDLDRDGAAAEGVAAALSGPPVSFADLLADAGMLDDEGEAEALQELPLGDFLLESRTLWLIRFIQDRKGRVLRESVHRPAGEGGAGGGGRPLVVSTYTLGGELVRRAKQYAVHAQMPYRVVAAELTPSREDLVVWCHVGAQAADVDSFGYFSVHVLNVESGLRSHTPRIEVYDHSRGACPPAFAVSPRVPGLGSEYLVVGLGHGLLGFYSLASGALVRAVQLPGIPPHVRYFSCLSLFTVAPALACPNSGKSFVAVTPANSTATHLYELDDDPAVRQTVSLVSGLGPTRDVAPPVPPDPVLPSSTEVDPLAGTQAAANAAMAAVEQQAAAAAKAAAERTAADRAGRGQAGRDGAGAGAERRGVRWGGSGGGAQEPRR